MIRTALLLTTAAAGLIGLAACNQPSTQAKAKVGDCYSVVSVDSLGKPTYAKAPCAEQTAAGTDEVGGAPVGDDAAATDEAPGQSVASADSQSTAAAGSSGAQTCVKVPVCAPAGGGAPRYVATSSVRPKVRAGAAAAKRRVASRGRSVTTYASGGGSQDYVGLGIDYARVSDQDRVKTFAASGSNQSVSTASNASYSSSSTASSSYSSSSSSSGYGYAQQGGCPCPQANPGPHIPFDAYGFLTWQGKVSYSQSYR